MSVFADGFDDAFRQRVRWQDHRCIPGMHAGKLDVLEHPADDDGGTGLQPVFGIGGQAGSPVPLFKMPDVSDAIDVHFRRVFEEFVHQHGTFG